MKWKHRKENPGYGGRITFFSYFCALAVASLLILPLVAEAPYKGGGIERVKVPYLVLELPLKSGLAQEGPLAAGETPGEPHDTVMRRKGLLPAEYAVWLRRWPWEGEHYRCRVQGEQYEIYYVKAAAGVTRIPIPAGYEYTITGDGGEGFAVAVHKPKRSTTESIDTEEGGNKP